MKRSASDLLVSRPLLSGLALGIAHAIILMLAFPPVSLGVLAILAPLPLLLAAMSTTRPWRCAAGIALGTLPFWAYHHFWVFAVSYAGAPPLIIVQSLWPGLFVAFASIACRHAPSTARFAVLAVIWTGLEFFRGRLFFDGYPWFLTAHPTADLPLAGWATVIGVYGVGLLIVLLCASFLEALRSTAPLRWVAPTLCLILLACGGLLRSPTSTDRTVTIAVVQTNLPQSNKMSRSESERIADFSQWTALTERAAGSNPSPDLIVWPETMFPGATLSPQAISAFADLERRLGMPENRRTIGTLFVLPLLDLQYDLGVPMLVGSLGYENLRFEISPDGSIRDDYAHSYNSAFLITEGDISETRYDKIFLTPFGETMPYISRFPRLQQAMLDFAARGMSFDLSSGSTPVRFKITTASGQTAHIATPICFEATIPHICRKLVYENGQRKADVLINMTNDGWFGSFDPGRANHLLIARWRAIELGTPVVRAANTGISCVVDARGRVTSSLGPRQPEAALNSVVPLPAAAATIYAHIGDLVAWTSFAASLLFVLVLPLAHRRHAPGREAEPSESEK